MIGCRPNDGPAEQKEVTDLSERGGPLGQRPVWADGQRSQADREAQALLPLAIRQHEIRTGDDLMQVAQAIQQLLHTGASLCVLAEALHCAQVIQEMERGVGAVGRHRMFDLHCELKISLRALRLYQATPLDMAIVAWVAQQAGPYLSEP